MTLNLYDKECKRNITKARGGHYRIIKVSIHQEDFEILNDMMKQNLNSFVSITEIEFLIKLFLQTPGSDKFYQ